MNDLFVLFPDLPWPRHSWRSLAEQVRDRRRRLEEVRRTIARQRAAVPRIAAEARARALAHRERTAPE